MDRIDHLSIFIRIADCGSFTLAAEQLQLPRPTLSVAMRQLEARLGTRLLHRTTRQVSLTQDGQALLERARGLIADLEELEQQFLPGGQALTGRLRVDVPSRIARRLIAPALPDFFARHPDLQMDLGSSDRTIDLVQEGVDCALRVGTLPASSLVARPLGRLVLINCASAEYLARHGTPGDPRHLDHHLAVDYVPPGGGRAAPWEWTVGGETHTRTVHSQVSANNAETYIACALAGLGLIQIPAYDVQALIQSGRLVEVMPQARPAPMPVHLVYPHRRHPSRRLQAFVAWIEALLRPHLSEEPPATAGGGRGQA